MANALRTSWFPGKANRIGALALGSLLAIAQAAAFAPPARAGLPMPSAHTTVHDANHVDVTSTRIGSPVHVAITVTGPNGTPTGTATGSFYINGTCSGIAGRTQTKTLVHGTYDFVQLALPPIAAGMISFRTMYNGDAVYAPVPGSCVAVTVTKILPSVAITDHDTLHRAGVSILVGTKAHAAVKVSSTYSVAPTGTVRVRWYAGANCTGLYQVSTAQAVVNGWADITSFTRTWDTPKWQWFKAFYSGGTLYEARTSACTAYSVVKATPVLSVEVHDALHHVVSSVQVHESIHIAARLSGPLGTPSGGITISLYNTASCTGASTSVHGIAGAIMDPAAAAGWHHTAPTTASLQVTYGGNTKYLAATGPCMTVTWVAAPSATASPTPVTTTARPTAPPATASPSGTSAPTEIAPSPTVALTASASASAGASAPDTSPAASSAPTPLGSPPTTGRPSPSTASQAISQTSPPAEPAAGSGFDSGGVVVLGVFLVVLVGIALALRRRSRPA